ncbi:hypothetical protein [Amycolatopsis sp. PS_44_ISF1]|uniref:hypothetical protein n=1 Tax=Amycolatopsis sp. PS_44_ISF1 TaxID=2974917 RepID=UPI0028DEC43A|nr:hypothetical protein [Amycolatopsis sp. PS_44_ISF1]MDT8911772.1 hypothetical protein [Amycolatopsis sp. PS_44_ISF1]
MDAPDFDSVAESLYAGEPGEFVAARTEAARAATTAGDRELAARIRALRKPTRAAFFVNRLAGAASLSELAALGTRLREAHTNLAGAELRELAHRRHELVRRIMTQAAGLSEPVAREVEETLEAVVADPSVAELALAGRLTSMVQPDTDQWLSLPVSAPKPKTSKPDRPSPAKHASRSTERKKAEKDREALARREERRREAATTQRERADAERALTRAERAAEQSDARVADLRTRLAEAETRATQAAADLEAARTAFTAADQAAKKAAAALE